LVCVAPQEVFGLSAGQSTAFPTVRRCYQGLYAKSKRIPETSNGFTGQDQKLAKMGPQQNMPSAAVRPLPWAGGTWQPFAPKWESIQLPSACLKLVPGKPLLDT